MTSDLYALYHWFCHDLSQAHGLRVCVFCGHHPQEILQINGLPAEPALEPGMRISLPCYSGALRPDPWDTPQEIAERFRFEDLGALAKANGLEDLAAYDGSLDLQLPGWHFFHARAGDTLEILDRQFSLEPGSCVAVGRVFRPHTGLLYSGEIVGVPI